MNKGQVRAAASPQGSACSDQVCAMLDRVGVPRDSKWRGLILYMRSIKNYDFLDNEQKEQFQALVMEVLRAKDFSEEKFQEVIKANERILAAPWNRALTRTLRETASLVQEFQDTLFRHKGGVQQLEDVTVGVVESDGDVDRMLGTIRRGFTEMVSMIEEDAEKMVAMSLTDALTGIANRRAFDEHIQKAVAEAVRDQRRLSLFMCDIDHFKLVNDTKGHGAGDELLRELTRLVRAHIRSVDALFRYGGEEFIVTLPHTNLDQAGRAAEKLRALVAGQAFPQGLSITISLGVAELRSGESADALMARVDEALYRAKAAGRNQVMDDAGPTCPASLARDAANS